MCHWHLKIKRLDKSGIWFNLPPPPLPPPLHPPPPPHPPPPSGIWFNLPPPPPSHHIPHPPRHPPPSGIWFTPTPPPVTRDDEVTSVTLATEQNTQPPFGGRQRFAWLRSDRNHGERAPSAPSAPRACRGGTLADVMLSAPVTSPHVGVAGGILVLSRVDFRHLTTRVDSMRTMIIVRVKWNHGRVSQR